MSIELVKDITGGNEIPQILGIPGYEFPHHIFQNEHLAGHVGLLCMGGSLAYGTNLPGKGDVDIRGMFMEKPDEIIGLRPNPGQFEDTETDTVIYSFNKLAGLLLECNPNVIELLGCKPEHYFLLNTVGEELIKHQELFLSQRCISSFGGYARTQLSKLENALARDRLSDEKKAEHVRNSMDSSWRSFDNQYGACRFGDARLYTGKTELGVPEIYIDIDFQRFPVKDFNSLMNVLTNVYRAYNKLNHRNRKDDEHVDKHAMHLLRLYYMCIDILEQRKVITYRAKERPQLLEVRMGAFRKSDGTYHSGFFDLHNQLVSRFEYAQKHTELPIRPDFEQANEFVFEMNKLILAY